VTVAALAIRIALIAGLADALRSVVVDETVSIRSARLGSAGDHLLAVGSGRICGTVTSISVIICNADTTILARITTTGIERKSAVGISVAFVAWFAVAVSAVVVDGTFGVISTVFRR
jgi:hypothetical protein